MQFLISVSCLLAVCFAGALATEECHFNQYINSKLVSDYSAVLLTIDSLADCLSYLKNNKQTHKVVAFDAETRRCCSVLQTLSYEVLKEYGWTTFEIREEHHGNQTTQRPSEPATQRSTAWTTGKPGNFTELTTGLCDSNSSNSVYYLNGKHQFSVYSYDFNLCENYYSGRFYNDNMYCTTTIVDNLHPNLKVELIVNSYYWVDFVLLENFNFFQNFSGESYKKYELVIPGNRLNVTWFTDSQYAYPLGFCLTVSGTYDQPSSNDSSNPSTISYDNSTEASWTTERPGSKVTTGICDSSILNSNYFLNGTHQFSVYSYDFNLCENFYAGRYYNDNMNCTTTIVNYWHPNLKVELIVNSQYLWDYVRLENFYFNQNFSGESFRKYETVLRGNTLDVTWFTDSLYAYSLGFCLTVSGTNDEPSSNDSSNPSTTSYNNST